MTSQPQPVPDGRPIGPILRPLRDLAAWALVAVPAVLLLVAIIRLIPSGDGEQFASRTQDSFYSFVNVPTIVFPLGAVLLSLLVRPQHPKAKLITVVAAVEYAVAAFFGLIFGVLVGLVQIAGFSVRTVFEELLVRVAWLALFAIAAWATYQVWRSLFHVPKPKPAPGVYGQPQYGVPGAYPNQPGYGQPGQPGQPSQPGQPGPAYGQPGYPQPGQPVQPGWGQQTYGQPVAQPGFAPPPAATQPVPAWGQPPVSAQPATAPPAATQPVTGQPVSAQPATAPPVTPPPVTGQPVSAQPAATQPVSTQPASGHAAASAHVPPPGPFAPGQAPAYPPPPGGFADPTQVVPRHDPAPPSEPDRTAPLPERPEFGPADQDPPRR